MNGLPLSNDDSSSNSPPSETVPVQTDSSIPTAIASRVIETPPSNANTATTIVSMESFLLKKGKSFFHFLTKRYYVLSGQCLYYYIAPNDPRPKGVIFLIGCIIERMREEDMEIKGYYGFAIEFLDLFTASQPPREKRILYCHSSTEREKWVTALQHAAHVVPIEDDYVIGKELGRGRFWILCDCVHKESCEYCTVKIVDKAVMEPEEKSLLRTEIAVLKLVNNPNQTNLEGLYENNTYLYIVTGKSNSQADSVQSDIHRQ